MIVDTVMDIGVAGKALHFDDKSNGNENFSLKKYSFFSFYCARAVVSTRASVRLARRPKRTDDAIRLLAHPALGRPFKEVRVSRGH